MDLMPVADADHDSDQIVDFPSCALMTTMVIVRLAILMMIMLMMLMMGRRTELFFGLERTRSIVWVDSFGSFF
jgi:hypothetical protein